MAEKNMTLHVITPRGSVVKQEEVTAVYVQTPSGSMGFLPGHTPLIAALVPHILRYEVGGKTHRLFVANGLVEVLNNEVNVLTTASEGENEVDFARAQASYERAAERLHSDQEIDRARAQASLNRAKARLSLRG